VATRFVAMGDPQASSAKVMAVLRAHALLTADDRLRPEVHLVSMGDHFDWGERAARSEATFDALKTLLWLSSHPPEQVTLLLGNHDLARVGELAVFDDDSFAHAQGLAEIAYAGGQVDAHAERALLAQYPAVPDAECLARDYGCFAVAQRDLVTSLLRTRRFRLAASFNDLLLVHAGVTVPDLQLIGIDPTLSAADLANALNRFLDDRVIRWTTGALNLDPFHRPGSAAEGEGTGAMYHRPIDPVTVGGRKGPPPRRRFDPRELPSSVTQVIGHIRDVKCRQLMPNWCEPGPGGDGIRSLRVDGELVEYRAGVVAKPALIFIDAGMHHVAPEAYPLFDLMNRRPLEPRAKANTDGV
jgi:hypothetical protein